MTRFNPRVFTSHDPAKVKAQMAKIGAEDLGIARMLPKAGHFIVKLHGVRSPAALILKEEMLAKGGDAAIHRDCITNRVEQTDVLLMGTEKVFLQVVDSLREQPFSLKQVADELIEVIEAYKRSSPLTPSSEELTEPLKSFYSALRERTLVMGVLNVTPDSFSDGGLYFDTETAISHGIYMASHGADCIDVGGESSRPGSMPISVEEELSRVCPVIEGLARAVRIPISIDTYKPEVARAALDLGATIVNDITGLTNPKMRQLVAERKVPVIIMHMKGTPQTMQENPTYDDVVSEIMEFLRNRIQDAVMAGLPKEYTIIDPGIGFGKTVEHNVQILHSLGDFRSIGVPVLVGTSRKSFIGRLLGGVPTDERAFGTAATVALAVAQGANIVRVHDVKEMAQVVRISDAVARGLTTTI
jgi:dihydropteroate synthase